MEDLIRILALQRADGSHEVGLYRNLSHLQLFISLLQTGPRLGASRNCKTSLNGIPSFQNWHFWVEISRSSMLHRRCLGFPNGRLPGLKIEHSL